MTEMPDFGEGTGNRQPPSLDALRTAYSAPKNRRRDRAPWVSSRDPGWVSDRHVFDGGDLERSKTPEAIARRRQTFAARRQLLREAVVACRGWGMVVEAVADYVGVSDRVVRELLREAPSGGAA
jgi:hypothetical protein